MIRKCNETDLNDIYHIINDSAAAYKGKIPNDRYHEPYITMEEKYILLKKYWNISERQIETSVVLCDNKWNNLDKK